MSTSSQTLDAKAPADSCNGVPIPLWIFLGLLWLQLFYALVPSWENGEYYDYGWLVPIAAGLLFWRRWVDESRVDFKPAPILNWVVIGLVFVAVLGIGFLRIAERFDNLWRIPLWIHAIGVVAAHHALLALVRGPKFTIS
ncbi:MAG: archaeosortase/exosortase family protein, partial [Verrucomicrobiota bacterium]